MQILLSGTEIFLKFVWILPDVEGVCLAGAFCSAGKRNPAENSNRIIQKWK